MLLTVDAHRIMDRLQKLGSIGQVPDIGLWRRPYTKAYRESMDLLTSWMKEAGLAVRHDAIGNLIGSLPGNKTEGGIVCTGSHLDTVKNGGKFDGALGIVVAIEVVQVLKNQCGNPDFPIEVIAFIGEEGSWFPYGCFGSRAMVGELSEDDLQWTNDEGITLAEAMRQEGYNPESIQEAHLLDHEVKAFIELHIEQGRILYDANIPVGIVQSIVGLRQIKITIKGRADHAGTTPMNIRYDPMVAAAEMITATTELVRKTDHMGVITFGQLLVVPNMANVIAEEVELVADIRHPDLHVLNKICQDVQNICKSIAQRWSLEVTSSVVVDNVPVDMDPEIVNLVTYCANQLGIPYQSLYSGAGHDAMILGRHYPTGMIFVPSRAGRSHCPEEWTDVQDIEKGTQVLYRVLYELAYN